MWKNYLKIAYRNLRRNKSYAAINVVGLAVAMAAAFLIFLFIQDELSYDRFHEGADRIYRLAFYYEENGQANTNLRVRSPLGPTLAREFPEVENAVRIDGSHELRVAHRERSFYEQFFYADTSFFDVFDFPLLRGDPQTALAEPYTAVITEETAEKYFGAEDPMGKTLTIWDLFSSEPHEYEVTGVAESVPHNSHFHFDILTSYRTLESALPGDRLQNGHRSYTYVRLTDADAKSALSAKFPDLIARQMQVSPEQVAAASATIKLQPLTDIHLHSHFDEEIEANSDVRYVYIFSVLALLILGIAAVNYTNLATARSSQRAREVGVRKVVGAHRFQLVRQFLSESLLLSTAALVGALLIVQLSLPFFSQVTGKSLDAGYFSDAYLLGSFLGIALLVGLLAGSYPALYLSGFEPARVLKGLFGAGQRSAWLRRGLVVFQFAVSVALITGTVVIQHQLDYIQTRRLGLSEEHVLMLHARDELNQNYAAFKNELIQHTDITGVAESRTPLPARERHLQARLVPEGMTREEAEESNLRVNVFPVDPDFTDILDIPIIEGRGLREEIDVSIYKGSDPSAHGSPRDFIPVLVNEAAVEGFGWEEPIGKVFTCCWNPAPRVVGVVQNFHYQSLKQRIQPLVLMGSAYPAYVMMRVRPEGLPGALEHVRAVWSEVSNLPMEYTFLDRRFDQLYRAEERLAQVFGAFAFLAILIACLGLFGLAAYMAERRAKEIGIRKVFGASIGNIVGLLSKDFAWLVLIAFAVAAPVAYYAMNRWLEDFAYRIELSPWLFVGAGLLVLLVAMTTVSYQALRASLTNPTDTLRYE